MAFPCQRPLKVSEPHDTEFNHEMTNTLLNHAR